jgi:hypothetical protein
LRMVVNEKTRKLSDSGITQISLNYQDSDEVDANGNEHRQQGTFQRTLNSGQVVNRNITDVWLNHSPLQQQRVSPPVVTPNWGQQMSMMQTLLHQLLQQWLQMFQVRPL